MIIIAFFSPPSLRHKSPTTDKTIPLSFAPRMTMVHKHSIEVSTDS